MVEANIVVPKSIWIDAQRYALRYVAFFNIMKFYAWRFVVVWISIAIVDGIAKQSELISEHFKVLFLLWVIACFSSYINWYLGLNKAVSSFSFHAKLENGGVYTQYPESFIPWSTYYSIVDRGGYYLIRGRNGISVLPKDEKLKHVVELSLKNIPNR